MTTYGNCYGKNQYCEYVNHPLNYYRRTATRLAKMGDKPVIKEAEKSSVPRNKKTIFEICNLKEYFMCTSYVKFGKALSVTEEKSLRRHYTF